MERASQEMKQGLVVSPRRLRLEGLLRVSWREMNEDLDREPPAAERVRRGDGSGGGTPQGVIHEPVLLRQCVDLLAVSSRGTYLDVTAGTAGHSRAILERLGPAGLLVAMDRDGGVLEVARRRLRAVGSPARVVLRRGNFADLDEACRELGLETIDGVVADLGVSSRQLEEAGRGFSYTREGPLDMRFDRNDPTTAADLLSRLSASDLTELLRRYGEEPRARLIAGSIVGRRRRASLKTTTDLARAVRSVVPPRAQADALARTFQALRIAVNRELESLECFLASVPRWLARGGRLVVVSFHSLEDRLVKRAFARGQRQGILRVLTPKPLTPTEDEVARNPRSRSARLRAAEKLLLTGRVRPRGGD